MGFSCGRILGGKLGLTYPKGKKGEAEMGLYETAVLLARLLGKQICPCESLSSSEEKLENMKMLTTKLARQ